MTSAKGRTTRDQQIGERENLLTDEENELPDGLNEEAQITGWDQDEIDLWRSSDNESKNATEEEIPAQEIIDDDWVSQRRKLLELQKKRWNWDNLGPDMSLTTSEATTKIKEGVFTERLPSMDIIEAQRILKSTQPAQQHSVTGPQLQDNEQLKRKGAGAVIVDDGKQHWMPDSLCKQCYACEASFTLLRRKHHCRLCGMIFW